MKNVIIIIVLLYVLVSCSTDTSQIIFFENGFCDQKTAKTQKAGENFVEAKIEGKWQKFKLAEFPKEFLEWNTSERLEQLDIIKSMMLGKPEGSIKLAGPHNGVVATYGFQRKDTQFKLNNAVKGMGFLPKREKIKDILKLLEETKGSPMPEKLEILKGFYKDPEAVFALDKHISLELYSTPEFLTQSFLNQMVNPISTIVFLDTPSYKLKTITRLLDPNNHELNDYEKDVVDYINAIHSYFHGHFSRDFIAVIYYVVEIYDNSPRGKDPNTGMGRKIVPLIP